MTIRRCRSDIFPSQVSRQGEWLVFTEKYGLLTTQNGTQQVDRMILYINQYKCNFRNSKIELNLIMAIIKSYLIWDIEETRIFIICDLSPKLRRVNVSKLFKHKQSRCLSCQRLTDLIYIFQFQDCQLISAQKFVLNTKYFLSINCTQGLIQNVRV